MFAYYLAVICVRNFALATLQTRSLARTYTRPCATSYGGRGRETRIPRASDPSDMQISVVTLKLYALT